jgi:asparaginyl-tRNA synthetase
MLLAFAPGAVVAGALLVRRPAVVRRAAAAAGSGARRRSKAPGRDGPLLPGSAGGAGFVRAVSHCVSPPPGDPSGRAAADPGTTVAAAAVAPTSALTPGTTAATAAAAAAETQKELEEMSRKTTTATNPAAVPPPPPGPTPVPTLMRVRAVREAPDDLVGASVTVRGWVRSVRDQRAFAFVDLNDGSSVAGLQVVVDADSSAFAAVPALTTGCSVTATGTVVESPGKGQRFELRADTLQLVGTADPSYPLQKKRHSLEFLRSIAHLRPRTNAIGAMARVRSTLAVATHSFFSDRGFLYLNAPVITASDCEGAGEMFRVTTAIPGDALIDKIPVIGADSDLNLAPASDQTKRDPKKRVDFAKDFFGKPAFLTVSGQLSAETYACALSDVYTFGPTFRAENSNTARHLAEFWMIEPEMAFATLDDDMDNAEAFFKSIVAVALARCAADLEFLDKFIEPGLLDKLRMVVAEPFARVTYTDAVDLLLKANTPVSKKGTGRFTFPVEWGCDLQSEHERYLAEEHFKIPVFVYNYPSTIKAFYMRDNDDDGGRTVQAMDLLVPGIGELIGGSAREERLHVLERKLMANNLNKADYEWYLDLRRYGSVPHAGYGMGFERLVQFVTGMDNIRDAIPYPRYPGSAQF